MTDAGLSCSTIARRSTLTVLADVALANMPYPTMRRDASSSYAMSHLPSGSSARSVCHSELKCLRSYLTRGTHLARLPALFTMPCITRILRIVWCDRSEIPRTALIAVRPPCASSAPTVP